MPVDIADPSASLPAPGAALLLTETSQGLVRRDAEGQIEPALAKRWIVLDEGRTYVFRLNELTWEDGTTVTARQVAARLRSAARPAGGNRLAPLLADIEEINAVTPQILEIILRQPRIDFLQLLAQPDLAIRIDGQGLGPYSIAREPDEAGQSILLVPRREPVAEDEFAEEEEQPVAADMVELRFANAAMAVARFQLGQSDLALGGSWTTLPYASAADIPAARIRLDPVDGLFGLAVVEREGFLSTAQNREILSLAIDRRLLGQWLGPLEAEPRLAVVSPQSEGQAEPVSPPWAESNMALRREFAREAVAQWRSSEGPIEPLRVALPDEPGSRVIFAIVRLSWAAIGVPAERVDWDEDADLRLIDQVAGTESANWYLNVFRCDAGWPCPDTYRSALEALEEAETERVRAIRTSEAATELQAAIPFIPLLRPVRWSLVAPRLTGFAPNGFASHPLDQLIAPTG